MVQVIAKNKSKQKNPSAIKHQLLEITLIKYAPSKFLYFDSYLTKLDKFNYRQELILLALMKMYSFRNRHI